MDERNERESGKPRRCESVVLQSPLLYLYKGGTIPRRDDGGTIISDCRRRIFGRGADYLLQYTDKEREEMTAELKDLKEGVRKRWCELATLILWLG
jgi:hypothetical protein